MRIVQPHTRHLRRELAAASHAIAERLAKAGHRTWIVGGAVRDLALGRRVDEVDLCTSALPDEIESSFEHTIGVGKAFGTVVVVIEGENYEVTTFRSERGYSDGRHPDEVAFGASPEEDAERRDFTINALFLDPLTQEVLDPMGGLGDLSERRLKAIGEPRERFAEDSLRLLRLARFAARLDFQVDPATYAAAQAESAGIGRVSVERIYRELTRILVAPRAHDALRLLEELGVLEPALPGWAALHGPHLEDEAAKALRFEALEWLESSHEASGIALLFDPLGASQADAAAQLERLRPSKAQFAEVRSLWSCLDALEDLWPLEDSEVRRGPDRSIRLRILADPAWPRARDLAAAFGDARQPERRGDEGEQQPDGHLGQMARELAEFAHGLGPDDIAPAPWVAAKDLISAGVSPGPKLGQLLAEVFELQLQGELGSAEAALAWALEQAS